MAFRLTWTCMRVLTLFQTTIRVAHRLEKLVKQGDTHMSRGYTRALARTAPVAPATARPQGGIGTSFDCPAMAAACLRECRRVFPFLNLARTSKCRAVAEVTSVWRYCYSNLRYEEFEVRYGRERRVWRASGERRINGLRECCCDIGVHILGGLRLLPVRMRVSREHPLNGR